ncbi:major facilitator superfamily domain-containing protein [Xylariales sp. PMI_506]|nr:major facilitator superfamily domain-containing protein [Xylariales sp. PMI_506]
MVSAYQAFKRRRERKAREKQRRRQDPEVRKLRSYRWKVIFGLFGPFALQSLDTTVIASALPFIATDFNEIKQLNWIISSFNLTSAAFLPFWAQLTDIFGRHVTVQAAIILMLVGSAICTGAPTSAFGVLLLGRAVQGVGAAGVNMAIRTILADRVSLADYAKNWTLFALCAGISFGMGPTIGGFLTQVSWRWCFAINLPICVASIVVVAVLLRKELLGPQPLRGIDEGGGSSRRGDTSTRLGRLLARAATFDYGGQMLFLWGLGLLILALTWGGGTYPWGSAIVLAPLIVGGVLAVCWVIYEYLMSPNKFMAQFFPLQRAMMPWDMLSQSNIGLLFFVSFTLGMTMFAVMYFLDLYYALVEGKSSSDAGLSLMFYLPGLSIGAIMAMLSSNVWPRQTFPVLLFGSITSAVSMTVMVWAIHEKSTTVLYIMTALAGHGIGIRMNPASIHGLAYFPTMTASISCLLSFAMPFGGLVGLTIMSAVFNNKSGVNQEDPKNGIMWAFISILPFSWLAIFATTFLGNVWLLKDGGHEVVSDAYLWNFVANNRLKRERRVRGDMMHQLAPISPDKDIHIDDVEPGTKRSKTDIEASGDSELGSNVKPGKER